MKVDIGGGLKVAPGHVNLDPVHGLGKWRRAAQETPWPAPDGLCEAVRASHVLEHVPAGEPRILVFNEAWRVLRPGGRFDVIVPAAVNAEGDCLWPAFADPTHTSWWVEQSFGYFDGSLAADADYGIRRWQTLALRYVEGWQLHWTGIKSIDLVEK